jgi:uncharacterized membrane protein HdeD (DUF308 family)
MTTTYPAGRPVDERLMLHALARNWWLILLKGICAILFGVLTFIWPGISLFSLLLLYGAYVLVDGVLSLVAAIKGGAPAPRWWLALVGVLGILAGLVTMFLPGMTAIVLVLFIAGWMIATGVVEIIGAIRLRKEIDNEWWLVAAGVLSVLAGVIIATAPGAGALGLLWLIGAYAIVFGITLVGLAFRLRRHSHEPHGHAAAA